MFARTKYNYYLCSVIQGRSQAIWHSRPIKKGESTP